MIALKVNGKSVPLPNTEDELNKVARLWIRRARYKLDKSKPFAAVATGKLRTSMKAKVYMDRNRPTADITPDLPYWEFVDLGVKGAVKSPYPLQSKSPFRFTSKMPPRDVITDWIKVRGLQGRDAKGRFIKRESLAYLIQRSIYFNGLRPRRFISDTGDAIWEKYGDSIAEALSRDLVANI